MARTPSEKDPFIVIDESERPPVVAYGGRSPKRSPAERRSLNREFERIGAGPYIKTTAVVSPTVSSAFGGSGTVTPRDKKAQVGEWRWDGRHHIAPSLFNKHNHIFYKVRYPQS
jgi:hypothetical protein